MVPRLRSPLPPLPPGGKRRALGRTSVCTTAILLISSAAANMVYAMQGGALDLPRAAWTVGGLLAGGGMIYVFHCHTMIDGGA